MKKIYTIILWVIAGATANAQIWEWAKSAGMTNYDFGFDISTDASGNAFVTGAFQSSTIIFGSTTLNNTGFSDMFIVKYDPLGTVLWAKSTGGTGHDSGSGISTDASGNVFVTGYFESSSITFGSTTLNNTGFSDMFIVKYDASGIVLWAKSAVGTIGDVGYGICTDTSGNVFVTGYFQSSPITFGSITLNSIGFSYDVFIVKYDASGTVLWAKSAGGTNSDYGYKISTDASGNAFVTGIFASSPITFGSITLSSAGSNDMFIAKYDPSGTVLWAKSAGGGNIDGGSDISTDASGNVFVTGGFQSSPITFGLTTLTNTNVGSDDMFIVKYDPAGNVLWAKNAVGAIHEYGYGISTDTSGNVFVTGAFQSSPITFGSITLSSAGSNDIFIAKYDPAGAVLWAKSAGGTNADNGYGTSTDASGNAFVTGYFWSSSITCGSTTLTNASAGTTDMFIAKLCVQYYKDTVSAFICAGDSLFAGGGWQTNAGLYTDTLFVLSGCDTIITTSLTVLPSPIVTITGDISICSGENTTLSANGGSSYLWSTGATSSSITVSPTTNTTYTVTDSTCGTATDSVNVSVNLLPTASAGSNLTIHPGASANLTATGGGTYAWSPATGLSCTNCTNPAANPTETTTYCVEVTNSFGCEDSACVRVFVDDCSDIFIPTAFSPNGDGQNELECVLGDCIETLSFAIYDRWGEEVFITDNPKICWDGNYKGKPINTAEFVYYLKATRTNGEILNLKGNISLIR